MNPDLQRLCEAVSEAAVTEGIELPYGATSAELIVRAVLTALREPSEGMIEAADTRTDIRDDRIWRADWRDELVSAIDHILNP